MWAAFPTLGVNAGVTSGGSWEGPGRVWAGNAESATRTPEKAIPAGGLSIKCGGWVKEAKLLLDVWPREVFPGENTSGIVHPGGDIRVSSV